MADGYQGYNKVKDTKRCCCFVHVRRYFLEAIPKGHEKDYTDPALQGFLAWIDQVSPGNNTRLKKALSYVRNRRDFVMTYLEDGRCSLSNNLSENSVRPVTVGRRNWLFSDTPDGASANALYLTIVDAIYSGDIVPLYNQEILNEYSEVEIVYQSPVL